MKHSPTGPEKPYILLFDDDQTEGYSLSEEFQAIYGSDWRLPPPQERPYTFINFVTSRDGRISFNQPGASGGGDISRNLSNDKWLMALLRARADAVLIGTSTLADAHNHRWTPEAVFKADSDAFAALRAGEGRSDAPTVVVVTRSGKLPLHAAILHKPKQPVVIATTHEGAQRVRSDLGQQSDVRFHITPGDDVDLPQLVRDLRSEYGVSSLLSEGGATIYGALLKEALIDDEFLTVSPIVVGNPAHPAKPRTSLVEGVGFEPDKAPKVDLLSLRRVDSYLFQRSRYRHSPE